MEPSRVYKKFNFLGFITLVGANGLAIWQFAINNGSVLQVLWIYWLQSVVIGLVNIIRILQAPAKAANLRTPMKGQSQGVDLSQFSGIYKSGAALFFTVHYGMFHLVYAIFLASFGSAGTLGDLSVGAVSIGFVILNGLIFMLHHVLTLFAERQQLAEHPEQSPGIKEIMYRPYKRIIPMHLIIIFGPIISAQFNSLAVFGAFIALKTLVDIGLFYKGTGHPSTISAASN